MININLGQPKNFNPENVDAISLDNFLQEHTIESMVEKNLKEIDWAVNLVFGERNPKLAYENIYVDNPNCCATYNLIYNLKGNETFQLEMTEEGNDFIMTVTVKNKNLIVYSPVVKNKIRKNIQALDRTVQYSVDIYQILNGIFNNKNIKL